MKELLVKVAVLGATYAVFHIVMTKAFSTPEPNYATKSSTKKGASK